MKLSFVERVILSNQYRILEKLYPTQADDFASIRNAIECGYEWVYDRLWPHINPDPVPVDISIEVVNILSMFSSIKRTYDALPDKSGIDPKRVKFLGFNSTNENAQFAFAKHYCGMLGGHFFDLNLADESFASKMPVLPRYRKMVVEWEKSNDKSSLSKSDIIRITSL